MLNGNRIEKLCEERKISKAELLNATGISRATLYNIINNIGSPSCENLEKLADFFNISMDYFFDREVKNNDNNRIGHEIKGNGNHVGDIAFNQLSECQNEVKHLNEIINQKNEIIKEKERTIQILINK